MPYFGVKINISPVLLSGKHGIFKESVHKIFAQVLIHRHCEIYMLKSKNTAEVPLLGCRQRGQEGNDVVFTTTLVA